MRYRMLTSDKGITLVELLVGLSLLSVISVMLISNLIGGMNSFKSVNNQISLQDEANYIMTQFVNQIFVAENVVEVADSDTGCGPLLKVINYPAEESQLGFSGSDAIINSNAINSSPFEIVCADSDIKLFEDSNKVTIKMVIEDTSTGKRLQLNNNVSFVKVE